MTAPNGKAYLPAGGLIPAPAGDLQAQGLVLWEVYTGASRSMVEAIRRDRGSDPHKQADLEPATRGVIRNENDSQIA